MLGNNEDGQLGVGSGVSTAAPNELPIALADGVLGVSTGRAHICALSTTNQVRCWGRGSDGALGYEAVASLASPPPSAVDVGEAVVRIAAGGFHSGDSY